MIFNEFETITNGDSLYIDYFKEFYVELTNANYVIVSLGAPNIDG